MLQGARDLFQSVFLSLPSCPFVTMASGHFSTIFGGDGRRSWRHVLHRETGFEEHGLDAGNVANFNYLNIGDEITSLDV